MQKLSTDAGDQAANVESTSDRANCTEKVNPMYAGGRPTWYEMSGSHGRPVMLTG
jgi:hypothetical protein